MGVPPTWNFGENNQGPLSNSTHPQLISNKFLPWFGLNKYYFFYGWPFQAFFRTFKGGKRSPQNFKKYTNQNEKLKCRLLVWNLKISPPVQTSSTNVPGKVTKETKINPGSIE